MSFVEQARQKLIIPRLDLAKTLSKIQENGPDFWELLSNCNDSQKLTELFIVPKRHLHIIWKQPTT